MLKPVASYPDPIRGGDDVLVMCEVMLVDGKPHPTNTRAAAARTAKKYKKHEPLFGIEQEFTLMKDGRPYGFPPAGYPEPQGGYYCGVGEDEIHGRPLVEDHLEPASPPASRSPASTPRSCPDSGSSRSAQPVCSRSPTSSGSPAGCCTGSVRTTASPSPSTRSRPRATGTAPALTPTSPPRRCARTAATSTSKPAARHSARRPPLHIANYGVGVEDRLTGAHETQRFDQFSYGVSDRGASIRIPWQVAVDKKGYLEDRRPNANIDPYIVARLMVDTVCGAMK